MLIFKISRWAKVVQVKLKTQYIKFPQPEWMLSIMYSMTICIHPVLVLISYISRIMEYHSIFWYGSCVRCGHCCCIILIPKQLIQLRPQWFSPKKVVNHESMSEQSSLTNVNKQVTFSIPSSEVILYALVVISQTNFYKALAPCKQNKEFY